jgi:hypothetical protein
MLSPPIDPERNTAPAAAGGGVEPPTRRAGSSGNDPIEKGQQSRHYYRRPTRRLLRTMRPPPRYRPADDRSDRRSSQVRTRGANTVWQTTSVVIRGAIIVRSRRAWLFVGCPYPTPYPGAAPLSRGEDPRPQPNSVRSRPMFRKNAWRQPSVCLPVKL